MEERRRKAIKRWSREYWLWLSAQKELEWEQRTRWRKLLDFIARKKQPVVSYPGIEAYFMKVWRNRSFRSINQEARSLQNRRLT